MRTILSTFKAVSYEPFNVHPVRFLGELRQLTLRRQSPVRGLSRGRSRFVPSV